MVHQEVMKVFDTIDWTEFVVKPYNNCIRTRHSNLCPLQAFKGQEDIDAMCRLAFLFGNYTIDIMNAADNLASHNPEIRAEMIRRIGNRATGI